MLAALLPVDAVIIFEADTADDLLRALRPEIYVKGGDYAHKDLPERQTVENIRRARRAYRFPARHSTSLLIKRTQGLQ